MKLCRFQNRQKEICVGLVAHDSTVADLSAAGITRIQPLLESEDLIQQLASLAKQELPRHAISEIQLLAPIERQEVWAAGVTYLRSKKARMEESDFSASAYDRVYEAERPELFFKSLPEKVVPPGQPVGIRKDSRWNVPEPELALVVNSKSKVVGYTIGNDMSSRDIEGENLLYLPQAKTYRHSCAVGPWMVVGADEAAARSWKINLQISRNGPLVFAGETAVDQIKRSFDELVGFLFRSQVFPHGVVLLTGTGIVPPDDFSLLSGDTIEISISGIGTLWNAVVEV